MRKVPSAGLSTGASRPWHTWPWTAQVRIQQQQQQPAMAAWGWCGASNKGRPAHWQASSGRWVTRGLHRCAGTRSHAVACQGPSPALGICIWVSCVHAENTTPNWQCFCAAMLTAKSRPCS